MGRIKLLADSGVFIPNDFETQFKIVVQQDLGISHNDKFTLTGILKFNVISGNYDDRVVINCIDNFGEKIAIYINGWRKHNN